jgi:hypothetical protein
VKPGRKETDAAASARLAPAGVAFSYRNRGMVAVEEHVGEVARRLVV